MKPSSDDEKNQNTLSEEEKFYSETCLCAVFRNWCQGPIIPIHL